MIPFPILLYQKKWVISIFDPIFIPTNMQYFMISLNISYKVYEKSEQIMVNNNINNKNTEKINIKNDSKLPVKPAKVNYQKELERSEEGRGGRDLSKPTFTFLLWSVQLLCARIPRPVF